MAKDKDNPRKSKIAEREPASDKSSARRERKSKISEREEEIQRFWEENKIFEKTLEKESPKGEFVFYDGPPFATGLPHYGHLLAGTIKDVIPRYKTMRGYRVPRRWGWDCHGLPLENIVEKELEFKSKEDIKEFGVDNFNKEAQNRVLRYRDDWMKIIPRTGRWVDMENDYRTMDTTYTESVWNVFKKLYDKDLIYEGFKSMHLCPRCGTTLSNFEVTQGYKDIKDIAVTVKLELESEPGTYILVWTTTPWTLPGNSAAALNPELKYVKVESSGSKYILAESRVESVFDGLEYKVVGEVDPKELLGKSYKPPFDFYLGEEFDNKENAWKIYEADYVDAEEGTGLVHLAPAFGEEDMMMAQEKGVPLIQHVGEDGKFKKEVRDFAGLSVKPKDTEENPQNHLSADIEIVRALNEKGILLKKENITHSYPHCWRCDTPLLNYASSSWFVKAIKLKQKLIEANNKISWVPPEIGSNRFGDWLENVKDWAISRDRYWGAPLPVWKNEETGEVKVISSVEDIKKVLESKNKYIIMRHGQAESNVANVVSSDVNNEHHLTDIGKRQVEESIKSLKNKKIDIIISSPFKRTLSTAQIVGEALGVEVITDKAIQEIQTGEFNGKPNSEYHAYFKSMEEKFTKTPLGGENLIDLKNRMGEFLYNLEKKYKEKTILIVSHEYPLWMLSAVAEGANVERSIAMKIEDDFIKNAEVRDLDFTPLPHNENYELDLHLPYIDQIEFKDDKGNVYKRIPPVFDCWFESGSMPYGQNHYPFNNLDIFNPDKNKGYPADFIAEGLDQTRGWFYSMLVLSVALFGEAAYKNVIVNGLVLAEDGKKMSKSLQNYPDPMYIINKYGADAMRYYMISSPVVRAQDLSFSEKGVDEIVKKVILKIGNIYSFVEMYTKESDISNLKSKDLKEIVKKSDNVLDKWILSRLEGLRDEVTENMDSYRLDKASRPILDFVDSMSVWYLRRSRDRFKEDNKDAQFAISTTKYVLLELSKLMAPFMPFLAEDLYQKVGGEKESVHLESWPNYEKKILGLFNVSEYKDNKLEEEMAEQRNIVSLALEKRAEASIKIRQGLPSLSVSGVSSTITSTYSSSYQSLISEEVNVKKIISNESLDRNQVVLDTNLTSELLEEAKFRDFIRQVQSMRKDAGLVPQDLVKLKIYSDKELDFIQKFEDKIKKVAGVKEILFEQNNGEDLKIEDLNIKVEIIKI